MSGLPENWEWDYDGSRWFYRYKPTGLIQYTFPKPGDEFPEYIDDSAPAPDLAPEEKLVSQQQVKRRSTLGQTTSRERASSNAVSDPDDGSGPFWLQPDALMYMGPGAYTDISPLQEEEEERVEENTKAGEEDNAWASVPAPTAYSNATESAATQQPTRSQISPIVSTATTPQALSSKPSTTTPELDSSVIVGATESIAADVGVIEEPEVHLLDSRQVPYNPIGFVAELASDLTAQCDDEINPAPVELPSNEQMMDTSEPGVYTNAFDLAPVELPSDEIAATPKAADKAVEQQPPASQSSGPGQGQSEAQRLRSYQAAQELLHRPYKPVRQHSTPQSSSSANPPDDPGPPLGQYQPYNPARHAVLGAAAANRYSVAEKQHRQPAGDHKRHSVAGPVLSQSRPTSIPAALQAPQVPPKRPVDSSDIPSSLQVPQVPAKRPLDSSDNGAYPTIAGAGGHSDSVSDLATAANPSSLAHFPSVLQPARGRAVMRAQTPPQSQKASPARNYQPYKPYRDLQKDIDDTVQLLSQTGYGQGTTASTEKPNTTRPQVSRTGTLPAHLPVLPFMGFRPKLPPSAASEPVTVRNMRPRQTPPAEASASKSSGPAAAVAVYQEYSAPLPPSSPDIPQPLNLSRKSPPPHNNVPTVASFRPQVTADPFMTSRPATPAMSSTPVVATTVQTTSSPRAVMHMASSGVAANTGGDAEQGTGKPEMPTTSGSPHHAVELKGTEDIDPLVTSTGQQPAPMQGRPEQAVASGFSVMVECPALPAPHVVPSRQQTPATSDTGNQPAPSASFAVESPDAPPIATNRREAPISSNTASTSQSVAYPGVSFTRQGAVVDQEPAPSTSEVVVQGFSRPISSQTSFVPSGDTQSPSHIVVDYQPVVEASRHLSSQPSAMPPKEQSARVQGAPLPGTSSAFPAALGRKPSSSGPANKLDVEQAVISPQPSITPQQSGVQTPSPASRASSLSTQQGNVPSNLSSYSPPETTTSSSQRSPVPTGHGVPNRAGVQSLPVGQAPSATGPPASHSDAMPAAGPTTQAYPLPSGHHPLSSHPVNLSEPIPAEFSTPKPERSGTTGSSDLQGLSGAPRQNLPVAHPQAPPAAQSSTVIIQPAGASTQPPQQLSRPPTQTPDVGQGQTKSNSSPPSGQQVPPPAGQTPQLAPAQGKASPLPFGPGQGSQNMPQRTFSHPVVAHPGSPPHPGAPGSAPPQMAMMFAPPGMPQGVRPGMVPRQYVFAPGAVPQGMQLQPVPPQMMQQPSQMLGGPAAYVMQPPPQPAQPVKEEKGWFGKLWRSESVKKPPTAGNDATNPANKLQKTAAHPQAPPVSPPPLYPANNKVSQGAPMPPHMMYPFQQGQQASHQQQQQQQPPQQQQQGVPPPTAPQFHPQHQQQHQQQQQQQQQPPQHQLHQHQAPLAWKTVSNGNGTGNGHSIGSGNRMPQFRTPNHNPGKSVIPPPEVRQAIQQQEQRLNPVRRESAGGAGGAGTPGQAQPHQGHGGQQQQVASSGPVSAQGNGMQSVVAAQAKIQGTGKVKIAGKPEAGKWGHANASAGGYDGSGWGDDDDGFS